MIKIRIERTCQVKQYEPLRIEVLTEVSEEDFEEKLRELGCKINQVIDDLRHPLRSQSSLQNNLDDTPF
jgi:sugar-specific transcriptional regulator TrmB